MKLTPAGIEYGDLNWNFLPGCLHKPQGWCPLPNCWAEGMWKRRMAAAAKKGVTLPDFHHPTLIPELLLAPLHVKKPSTILVNFMGDLMGDWVDPEQIIDVPDYESGVILQNHTLGAWIIFILKSCPQHRFVFLTKNPAGYAKWVKWPDNTWLGASVCNQKMLDEARKGLADAAASHKWLSIEPLLERLDFKPHLLSLVRSEYRREIDWVVIGAQSQPKLIPKMEWVLEITNACDTAGVPVWIKNNMELGIPRQERPR